MTLHLNPREVAELSGVARRVVEKAIEEKVFAIQTGRNGVGPPRRMLGAKSVVYTAIMARLSGEITLTLAAKRKLARTLRGLALAVARTSHVEIVPDVTADIGKLAGTAIDRTERYVRSRDQWITSDPGIMAGLPIIRGTRIPVHSVEGRVRAGDSLDDIIAENHDVPREAFEAALLFAKTHPLAGRPGVFVKVPA